MTMIISTVAILVQCQEMAYNAPSTLSSVLDHKTYIPQHTLLCHRD